MFLNFLITKEKKKTDSDDSIDFERDSYAYVFGENVRLLSIPFSDKTQTYFVKTIDGNPEPNYACMQQVSGHKTFYEITQKDCICYYPFNSMS